MQIHFHGSDGTIRPLNILFGVNSSINMSKFCFPVCDCKIKDEQGP